MECRRLGERGDSAYAEDSLRQAVVCIGATLAARTAQGEKVRTAAAGARAEENARAGQDLVRRPR